MRGMSQVVAIVVAGTVITLVGGTIAFLVTGGIGDFGSDISSKGCMSAAKQQCQVKDITSIEMPSSCYGENQSGGYYVSEELENYQYGGSSPSNYRVYCNQL